MAQIDPIAAGTLGLKALGNLLSLPRQVQYQQQQAALDRALLKMAMPEKTDEELNTLVASPALGFLSAGGEGVGRKVLGGVGDIGTMLSSLMGQPLPAMRVDPGEAGSLAQLELKRKEIDREEKLGGRKMPAGELGVLVQIGLDKGMSPQDAWAWAHKQYNESWRTKAQFSGGISRGNQSAGIEEREGTRRSGQGADVDSTVRTLRNLGVIPQGGPSGAPSSIMPQSAPAQPPSSGITPIGAYDVNTIPSEPPTQVPYRPGYKAAGATLTLPSGQVRYELEQFPKNETELVARSMGLDPNQQISDEDAMRLLMNMRKTKIGSAVAEAQALKDVWPPKTLESTIVNTNTKLSELTGVRINVVRKMHEAAKALSDNPLYARTLQSTILPWTAAGAFGATPEDQAAAKEVQILQSNRARLARMVDVGNLSGTEQDVWNPYLKGDTMTSSEMERAIQALEKDMETMGAFYERIISARNMDEYKAALRSQPPIAVPVDKYVKPQSGDPARQRFESLLQQYSPQ